MRAALLILSDRGARGERADASGPALEKWLAAQGVETARCEVIPDEAAMISARLQEWADSQTFDLILTCGGTGVSPRDVTPDATLPVLERVIPGFGEVMRAKSLEKTPHAMISRALAGIRKHSLIINLPGSPKGAIENLEAVWPAIPHCVAKLQGDPEECGQALLSPVPPLKKREVQAVAFVAPSGTGKTTLIEKVIGELKSRGWRVGAIKHDAHRMEIDHPGKDSYRMTAAGADTTLITSGDKLALVKRHQEAPSLSELLTQYFADMEIVLIEGFKQSHIPKIEVYRRAASPSLICRGGFNDPNLLAIASDCELDVDVPLFDLDDVAGIASFIEGRLR